MNYLIILAGFNSLFLTIISICLIMRINRVEKYDKLPEIKEQEDKVEMPEYSDYELRIQQIKNELNNKPVKRASSNPPPSVEVNGVTLYDMPNTYTPSLYEDVNENAGAEIVTEGQEKLTYDKANIM